MKHKKIVLALLILILLGLATYLFKVYVYVGTYLLPIAPYWVTQLPPNPPKPEIKHGEFNFKIKFSVDENIKEFSDVIICDFSGFEVHEVGGPKKRTYTQNFKNHIPFLFRDIKKDVNTDICIEKIGNYNVILTIPHAGWFLNDPDYGVYYNSNTLDSAYLRIYDANTKYYLYPEENEKIFKEHNFMVLEWSCDTPVKNTFK